MKDSIALDTETTGLEETDRPFSFSVATREGATNFDERIWQEQTWELARGYACNPNGVIFMQNAKFDMRMLSTKGVEVRGDIHDITALARLVRNDHLAYNLDSQAKRILNEPKDTGVMDYIKAHNLYEIRHDFFGEEYKQPQFDKVPLEVMAPYATKDAVLTRSLGEYYLQKLQGTRAMQVVENESKLVKTCYAMERRGLLLNKEYTLQAYHSERAIVEKLKQDFQDLTGQAYKDSAKSMQPLLTYRLPKTKEGNPSLDKHALKDLLRNGDTRDRQIAEMIRVIRKYDKRIATYYKNYLNKMDHEGVIHPTMWQAGTRTGRFSYSDPNFQNMPKDEDEGELYTIRGCVRPRAGRVFVSLDYSQMEYRMAVAYANESKVIKEVMAGADFHQSTADMVGITRSQAKTLNFACIAEGSLVLTDRGLVPIERVAKGDLVWDGVEFVKHGGVVYQGEKHVITHQGLTATPDHTVFTECGRAVPFGNVATQSHRYKLAVGEVGGVPVRYTYHSAEYLREGQEASKDSGGVPCMSQDSVGRRRKYTVTEEYQLPLSDGSPCTWPQQPHTSCTKQAVLGGAHSVYVACLAVMEKLRRAWHQNTVHLRGVRAILLRELLRRRGAEHDRGSSGQRWALSNRKSSPSTTCREPTQSQVVKVYDILNAGPRNRFTVSGYVVHNCLYGAGPRKIAEMLGVSAEEGKRLLTKYFYNLPRLEDFLRQVKITAESRGYIFNWYGRPLYFSWYTDPVTRERFHDGYSAPNHLIQGGGADVVKVAMNRIHEEFPDLLMVLQVHDQLVFEMTPEEYQYIPRIKQIMEEAFPPMNGMHLRVDIEWSSRSLAANDMEKGLPVCV